MSFECIKNNEKIYLCSHSYLHKIFTTPYSSLSDLLRYNDNNP